MEALYSRGLLGGGDADGYPRIGARPDGIGTSGLIGQPQGSVHREDVGAQDPRLLPGGKPVAIKYGGLSSPKVNRPVRRAVQRIGPGPGRDITFAGKAAVGSARLMKGRGIEVETHGINSQGTVYHRPLEGVLERTVRIGAGERDRAVGAGECRAAHAERHVAGGATATDPAACHVGEGDTPLPANARTVCLIRIIAAG